MRSFFEFSVIALLNGAKVEGIAYPEFDETF